MTLYRLYRQFGTYYGRSYTTQDAFKTLNPCPLRKPSHNTFFLRLVACVPVVFQSDCRRGETTLFSGLFIFTLLKRLFFFLGVHNDYTKNSYYI